MKPDILSLGAGPGRIEVARHGSRVSIFVQAVEASVVLGELRSAIGGPTFTSLEPLSRPVTLALHQVTLEEVLRRMLVGFNYTLQYREGRLSHVRVLHMIPGRNYKTPRAVESRSQWTRIELGQEPQRLKLPARGPGR